VCGEGAAMTHLPPQPLNRIGSILRRGAAALGWHTLPVPLAINSAPRDGRPACIRCQHCVGFACPVDAKNGSHNTFIARALAIGNCLYLRSNFGNLVQNPHSER
jgi:ferredoxin